MDDSTLLSEFSWDLGENECNGSTVPFLHSLDPLETLPAVALDGNPQELDSMKKTQQDHGARLDHLEQMLAKLKKECKACRRQSLSAKLTAQGMKGWGSELKMELEDIIHEFRDEVEEVVKKRVEELLKKR